MFRVHTIAKITGSSDRVRRHGSSPTRSLTKPNGGANLIRPSVLFGPARARQLMEQLDFVRLGIDDPVWDHSTFSKNRDRLLDADVAAKVSGSPTASHRNLISQQ
jgi:hypothetical protein